MAGLLLFAATAEGRPLRPRFEPTDRERPGLLDLDVELGYFAAPPGGRVLMPDFEIDLGLLPSFELDLDDVYVFDPSSGRESLPDNVWLSE